MKYSQGFTLVELLITVAIISILAVVATPSFLQTLANQRMKSAAYDLSATFAEARYQAALQRITMNVTTSGTAAAWKAASASKKADIHWQLIPAGSATPLVQSGVDRRISIASSLGSASALFLQNGTVATATGVGGVAVAIGQDVAFRFCDDAVTGEDGYTVVLGRFGGSRVYAGKFGTEGVGAQTCT
ncbi:MAG: prepilin-type N-terminal cleavage/methylation domain-containing protein [Moraxellaceae bacterium]